MHCFKNKTILITGHTGFQGFWLANALYLSKVKKIVGLGLPPKNYQQKLFRQLEKSKIINKSYFVDICNKKKFHNVLSLTKPDYIFHLASQPLVNEGYSNPHSNYNTNVNGSLNLLEWLRKQKKLTKVIFITSDKCYAPSVKPHKEHDALGGLDPYSASKSIQEILAKSYDYSFFEKDNYIKIATARSGNIYGGGDFTPGRLVPDIIQGIFNNQKITIRNPSYIRPWQYITDTIRGYLSIGNYLSFDKNKFDSFNFGPSLKSNVPVNGIINRFNNLIKDPIKINLLKQKNFSENKNLILNSSKARLKLKWKNNFNLNSGIQKTYKWHQCYFDNVENIVLYTQKELQKK